MGMGDESSPIPVRKSVRLTVAKDSKVTTRPRSLLRIFEPVIVIFLSLGIRLRVRVTHGTYAAIRPQNRNAFLVGSRRSTGSKVYEITEPIASSILTRRWTTGSSLPPVRGYRTSLSP